MIAFRLLLISLMFFGHFAFGQTGSVVVIFKPVFSGHTLQDQNPYIKWGNNDSLIVSKCKFYVSGLGFSDNGQIVFEESKRYHLIDAGNPVSSFVNLSIPGKRRWNRLFFALGIDSATQVGGALGGDLDPTNGMYWTWQSGYIHVKLEGKCNLSTKKGNEFTFHLGGFSAPFSTYRKMELPAKYEDTITVNVELADFFRKVNLKIQNQVMAPGKDAVQLIDWFANTFAIKPE